ncbi:MAG: NAD(P)H-dependent glycerol-3-phosphate dehydrogenase [Defluviitaleaceae bacterium]|nr:NAD(P)H-dependent glycerol-3-phosphate dehydrogenase [Defluviitaleaceae bacterium]
MKICIISAGSWGSALAYLLAGNGHEVNLWFRNEEKAKAAIALGENKDYLPGIKIPKGVNICWDEANAAYGCDIFVQGAPSHSVRETLERFKPFISNNSTIVNISKGLEDGSYKRLSQVIEELLPACSLTTLSGPTHAEEVAMKIPTAIVAASKDLKNAEFVQDIFMNENFRIYTSDDVAGVEIGGAIKNVIALAAGISDGMGFGDNTKAALMTRGMREISELGVALGAKADTFYGLSGIGDLIVTCTSNHSRNRRVGLLLGQGKTLEEATKEVRMVAEGVTTAKTAMYLANKHEVEAPITTEIYKVLSEGKEPKKAVYDLMTRDRKKEV